MKKNITLFISLHIFIFAALVICVNSFSGCSNSITNSTGTVTPTRQAMVERQFALSSGLKAEAGAVIVIDLEDLNSPSSPEDTGPIGEDIIPYTYTETAQHRFEIADSSNFKIKLISDSTGAALFELNPASFTVVTIPAGNYKLHLISLENYSASDSSSNVIFIQPNSETSFSGGSGSYSDDDVNTLIQTRKCLKCRLDNADLSNKNLRGVTIGVSSLNNTDFSHSDITLATFAGNLITTANFDYAEMGFTNMVLNAFGNCSFKRAKMNNNRFYKCGLYTTFDNVTDASNVQFSQCDLSAAKFTYSLFANETNFDSCFVQNNGRFMCINTNFVGTRFNKCRIRGSSFNNSRFVSTYITDCDLSYSDFTDAYFWIVSFCGSDKTGINSTNASFGNVECWP